MYKMHTLKKLMLLLMVTASQISLSSSQQHNKSPLTFWALVAGGAICTLKAGVLLFERSKVSAHQNIHDDFNIVQGKIEAERKKDAEHGIIGNESLPKLKSEIAAFETKHGANHGNAYKQFKRHWGIMVNYNNSMVRRFRPAVPASCVDIPDAEKPYETTGLDEWTRRVSSWGGNFLRDKQEAVQAKSRSGRRAIKWGAGAIACAGTAVWLIKNK